MWKTGYVLKCNVVAVFPKTPQLSYLTVTPPLHPHCNQTMEDSGILGKLTLLFALTLKALKSQHDLYTGFSLQKGTTSSNLRHSFKCSIFFYLFHNKKKKWKQAASGEGFNSLTQNRNKDTGSF